MRNEDAGSGEMPENAQMAESAQDRAPAENGPIEVEGSGASRQPDFRVVQPEYDTREGKTIFKDVGALWKNISQKTGKEFYTLKIGKMRLLVFPNQKMTQQ